jgi:hypothetical protein
LSQWLQNPFETPPLLPPPEKLSFPLTHRSWTAGRRVKGHLFRSSTVFGLSEPPNSDLRLSIPTFLNSIASKRK